MPKSSSESHKDIHKGVSAAISEGLKTLDAKKRGNSWYIVSHETVSVMNLQRSQWSCLYYINIGIFIEPQNFTQPFLPEYKADIRFRLEQTLDDDSTKEIGVALNYETAIERSIRFKRIQTIIVDKAVPILCSCKTISGVRDQYKRALSSIALVNSQGRALLGDLPSK